MLKTNGDTREWKTIKGILVTHNLSTIILKGEGKKVYNIRTSGMPESCHNEIFLLFRRSETIERIKNYCEKKIFDENTCLYHVADFTFCNGFIYSINY